MMWIVKRGLSPRYLGAYDWVRDLESAARFASPRVADRARDVAREKNSGVHTVRLRTRLDIAYDEVRVAWGHALDRAGAGDRQTDLLRKVVAEVEDHYRIACANGEMEAASHNTSLLNAIAALGAEVSPLTPWLEKVAAERATDAQGGEK